MAAPTTPLLTEILDRYAGILPALCGRVMPSENQQDNAAADIGALYRALAETYPEAGAVYWGCRTWQLWIWQPVFLCVWAASAEGCVVALDGFCNQTAGLFTAGFSLPDHRPRAADGKEAVVQTASQLKQWLAQQLPLLQTHYPLPEKLAGYLFGDSVLNALASAHRLGLLDRNATELAARRWQQVLGLRCNGRLTWQPEQQEFLVEMVACCQHHRRAEGDYCNGCPKTRKSCGCESGS